MCNLDLAITRLMCPTEKYEIKAPFEMKPEFIVIHNTWNTASAMNEISYMIRNNNYVSFHFAVDENQAVQGLPLDRNSWHSGDGVNGNGNRKGISIEICRSRSDLAIYIQAENNAAKLVALLLKQYNWGLDRIKYHYEFMDKHCPHRMLDEGRKEIFLNNVQSYLNELNAPKQETKKETPKGVSNCNVGDVIYLSPTATTYATGELIPQWAKERSHTVLEVEENRVLLKEIYSWINKYDVLGSELKSVHQIAYEVLNGKWGNGLERKERLVSAGYNYNEIQLIVNGLLGETPKSELKSTQEIADEVINGSWGNGQERKTRLEKAGYNYNAIQSIVNRKVGK